MSADGFFSIVQTKDKSGNFQVRSRAAKDLENLRRRLKLEQAVILTPHADYPARLIISPWHLGPLLLALGDTIQYDNFKNEIHRRPDQADKDGAYMDVWSTMRRTEKPRPGEPASKLSAPKSGGGYLRNYGGAGWKTYAATPDPDEESDCDDPFRPEGDEALTLHL